MKGWLRKRLRAWLLDTVAVVEPPAAPEAKPYKVSASLVARSKRKRVKVVQVDPFKVMAGLHPPGVVPAGEAAMALDSAAPEINAWAFANINAIFADGQAFLGYPLLAEMAQRPEYRRISETIARHMTRKWITFNVKGDQARDDEKETEESPEGAANDLLPPQFGGAEPPAVGEAEESKPEKSLAPDQEKLDKVARIEEVLEKIGAKPAFQTIAQQDGFFGRAHLYIDLAKDAKTPVSPDELKTSIGDGNDDTTLAKLANQKDAIRKVKPVEAVWCYPTDYNSTDPLTDTWYKPESWFVMGKQLHATRLLTFVGREVPDILKPAYSFGGLALSQMVKPYVENWINTRQSVANLIRSFSVFVLKTKLTDALGENGDELFKRIELFNNFRENEGAFVVDKLDEDFANVSATLAGLDKLQAQAQEQQASIAGIPIVLLLMITPSGLNASSEGEIQAFWDWTNSYQESFFRPNLTTLINMIQISEFGEVDPDIVFTFARLEGLNDLEWSQKQLTDAQTDKEYIDAGVIDPIEVRASLAKDPESRYHGIDVDDVPEPPPAEMPPGMGMFGEEGQPGEPGKPAPPAAKTKIAAAA